MEPNPTAVDPIPDYATTFSRQEHEWLYQFLHLPADDNPVTNPSRRSDAVEISIIDIIASSSARILSFPPSNDAELTPNFLQALSEVPSDSMARILLVSHQASDHIHKSYLNAIGWTYKIDPSFFEYHYSLSCHRDFQQKWRKGNIPTPLPSRVPYLQIIYDSFSHMTMWKGGLEHNPVIVILEHRSWLMEFELKKSVSSILPPNAQTRKFVPEMECVYPYIQSSLSKFAGFCNFHTWSSDGPRSGNSHLFQNVLGTCLTHQKELTYSMDNLARFLSRQGLLETSMPATWRDVINDYKALIVQTERTNHEIQAYLQAVQGMDALNETKAAIKQADSVRKLTFVAFVFIPLSFSCSFFGMNIKQLDSGTVNIGYFFLLAFLSALLAYIISASIKPSEQGLARARDRFADREMCDDSESLITARRILWKWMTRKLTVLRKLDDKWDLAERKALETHDWDDTAFTWVQVLWPFCLEIARGVGERLKALGSRETNSNQGAPEEG
ncbi:hypothetical protein ONS95_007058 [Cadophora gregata]|uniref:uncharacterized protein n=1 Tax=Cadophora gregata TaxID=51156 RepID=UPI0026DB2A76|nr:uncharacterized protein ONS95_007058 [Cadophora gregata]KAK0100603.1 hypothetical protein ONS95_007058 [Cadophora gregata]